MGGAERNPTYIRMLGYAKPPPNLHFFCNILALSRHYALLEEALTAFEAVNKLSTTAQVALSPENQFRDTRETAATLDCFTYLPQ